jgi:parallel beta-helix repeat protein
VRREILALAVVLAFACLILQADSSRSTVEELTTPAYAPIYLFSDQDIANRSSSGSGTASDPYVIENLEITLSNAQGIMVSTTTAHFVLRHLKFVGAGDAIWLTGVANASIENCSFVSGNVNMFTLRNIRLVDNTFNSGAGVSIGSGWVGDWLWPGDLNSNITIMRNSIYGFGYSGIDIRNADNVTVLSNTIENCTNTGLGLSNSQDVLASDNILRDNYFSVGIFDCDGVTLVANQIIGSKAWGFSQASNDNVVIHHNNFINNSVPWYPGNAEGTGFWIEYPYGGNYWENYSAPDILSGPDQNMTGSDGILDEPFVINDTYSLVDRYPLATPFARSDEIAPPAAALVVRPEFGRPDKAFTLDGSSTWDSKDTATELEFRWDFGDDGVWDTPWTSRMTVSLQYSGPDNTSVRMMVRDTDGLTDEVTKTLIIDRLAPILSTDFGPGKVTYTSHQGISINWSCEEDLSGLAGFEENSWSTPETFRVLINGVSIREIGSPASGFVWASGGNATSYTSNLTVFGLPDGDYTVVIQSIDNAGNIGELTIRFGIHTGILDPSGPYGPAPLVALIVGLIAIVVVVVYFASRPRKGSPEASSVTAGTSP